MNVHVRHPARRLRGRLTAAAAAAALAVGAMSGAAAAAGGPPWQLDGEVGHHLFYGTEAKAFFQDEVRYRLELRATPPWEGQLFVAWEGAAVIPTVAESALFEAPPADAWPRLQEAYVDLYLPALDLRLGQQVVAWGTADGFNPTDVVNPRRAGLDSLLEGQIRRIPVPAVSASFYPRPDLGVTAVGVVDFVPAPLPQQALRDRVESSLPAGVSLTDPWLNLQKPQGADRYELALRAESRVRGYAVYLSYFNGVDDWPALWVEPTEFQGPALVKAQVRGQYRRQQQYGLAVAGTAGGAGLWAEVAYTVPQAVEPVRSLFTLSSNDPRWEAVAGADYRWGDLYASGQLLGLQGRRLLSVYREPGADEVTRLYAVGVLRYGEAMGPTTWELAALTSLHDGSTVLSPGVTHQLRPGLEVGVHYLAVLGGGDTELGSVRGDVEGLATRLVWSF